MVQKIHILKKNIINLKTFSLHRKHKNEREKRKNQLQSGNQRTARYAGVVEGIIADLALVAGVRRVRGGGDLGAALKGCSLGLAAAGVEGEAVGAGVAVLGSARPRTVLAVGDRAFAGRVADSGRVHQDPGHTDLAKALISVRAAGHRALGQPDGHALAVLVELVAVFADRADGVRGVGRAVRDCGGRRVAVEGEAVQEALAAVGAVVGAGASQTQLVDCCTAGGR